jgi:LysR family glycine cleavage system transcriptional activator
MSNWNDMTNQRRFLPPLGWLVAFESTARRNSVTAAAAELDLSQGAVSRQIQKLEEQLGVPLFFRVKKRLSLTPQGGAYLDSVRDAVNQIASATVNLSTNPDGGALELAILPAFGTHWLAPRLAEFMALSPGVTLNLSTRTVPFDFSQDDLHAAIHFGHDDWPDTQSLKLMEEATVPVVSPSLIADPYSAQAQHLLDVPLLTLRTRPDAWTWWFAQQGQTTMPEPGMRFDQFATMLQAVLAGLGAALMPRYLVASDLKAGRLVALEQMKPTSLGSYFLVWPGDLSEYPPLAAFREWIASLDFRS